MSRAGAQKERIMATKQTNTTTIIATYNDEDNTTAVEYDCDEGRFWVYSQDGSCDHTDDVDSVEEAVDLSRRYLQGTTREWRYFVCAECKEARECNREAGLEDSCLYCSMPPKGNTSDEWMGWQNVGRQEGRVIAANHLANGTFGVVGFSGYWQVVHEDGTPVDGELFENAWAAMDRAAELSR